MADLTLATQAGDLAVLSCALTLPGYGLWTADLLVESSDAAEVQGAVTLSIKGESTERTLAGFVALKSVFSGRTQAKILGGFGGLIQPVGAKFFQKTTGRQVLEDLCAEVGEQLDPLSSVDVQISQWTRRAAFCASACLKDLCEYLQTRWRMQDSGKILVGDLEISAYGGEFHVLADDPINQRLQLDLPEVDLSPGMTLDGAPVDRVEYYFEPNKTSVSVRIGI